MLKLNGLTVSTFKFPAGEVGIKINSVQNYNSIYAEIKSSDDFMGMLLLANAVKESGGSITTLVIPYIPYGRQDRVCFEGEPFSLRLAANLINSIGAERVVTIDPHSSVTNALIDNLHVVDDLSFLPSGEFDVLVSPDAGAAKKSKRHAAHLSLPIVQCLKTRVDGGAIAKVSVHGDVTGKRCLITDDICDGGATFIALADALRNAGAAYIHLHVSHGIFSRGREHLLNHGIDSVSSVNYEEIF